MNTAAVDEKTAVGLAILEGRSEPIRELHAAGGLEPLHAEAIAAAVDLIDAGRKVSQRAILPAVESSPAFDPVQWSQLGTAATQALDAWTAGGAVRAFLDHRARRDDIAVLKRALESAERGGDPDEYLGAIREQLENVEAVRADPFILEPWDMDPLTPPMELVAGLIERGTTVGVVGPSGAGKSFYALDQAASIATGTSFHGRRVRSAKVAIFAGEGRTGVIRRLHGWTRYHGKDIPSDRLTVSRSAARITEPGFLPVVDRVLKATGAEVLIVDTLNRNAGVPFNENDTQDMTAFISNLDRLRERRGLTVFVVHHTGHGATDRARGSSVFQASLDVEFIVTMDESATLTIIQSKAKDTEPAPPQAYVLKQVQLDELRRDDGSIVTTAILEPTDSPRRHTDRLGKNQRIALRHLADLWREARHNVAASGRDPSEAAVLRDTWEQRAKGKSRKADGEHVPFPRWSEVVQSLTDAELIRFDGPIVHILTADGPSSWSGPEVRPGVFTYPPDRTDHLPESGEVRNGPIRTNSDRTDHADPEREKWWNDHRDEVF